MPYTRSVTSYTENNSLKHNSHAISTSQLQNPAITTPTGSRKTYRRISNIFMKPKDPPAHHIDSRGIGEGREIPIKHGYLYKKGNNRFRKKKYVCLFGNGRLCYYQNLKVS